MAAPNVQSFASEQRPAPTTDWELVLRRTSAEFDREIERSALESSHECEASLVDVCGQAGKAAWGLLHQRGWPIQSLLERLTWRPTDEHYVECIDPATGEQGFEIVSSEHVAVWWLELIG